MTTNALWDRLYSQIWTHRRTRAAPSKATPQRWSSETYHDGLLSCLKHFSKSILAVNRPGPKFVKPELRSRFAVYADVVSQISRIFADRVSGGGLFANSKGCPATIKPHSLSLTILRKPILPLDEVTTPLVVAE